MSVPGDTLPAPDEGPAGACADVRDLRVCWDPSGAPRWVERTVPASGAVSALGWRCSGEGAARTCRDRAFDASPFVCEPARCTQRHVRLPDDGVWECAEIDGALVCHGGAPSAGVVPAPAAEGWRCGARRGADERVCVDLSPDRAPGFPDCRVEHGGGLEIRSCAAGSAIGACPCAVGWVCIESACAPLAPDPGCWLDTDCGEGARCVVGTCRGG